MRNAILAERYARALYGLAKENGEHEAVFQQMRIFEDALSLDQEINEFITSPLIRPAEKVKALEQVLAKFQMLDTLKRFLLVLVKKNRLGIYSEIVNAYQMISDEEHGVTRGVVRSATVLAPSERKQIEELVSRATKKQVILTYKEDPTLLGGLVAQVGSFTFDDSLNSHLQRINEQLTRSVH